MTGTENSLPPLEPELDHTELRAKTVAIASPEREIDISFFLHRNRKSTKLIGNNSDDNWITARHDWLGFDFDQNIFISQVEVFAVGYEDFHEMELIFIDSFDNKKYRETKKYNGESFRFTPRKFIRGFNLNPDRPLFKSAKIRSINVRGIEQENFNSAVNVVFDIERVQDSVEARLNKYLTQAKNAEQTHSHLSKEISEKISELEKIGDEITALKSESSDLSASNEDLETKIARIQTLAKESNERRVALDNSISDREKSLEKINSDYHSAKDDLKSIKDNINLFPTEISGFVSQGTHHIRMYAILMTVPLLIISFVTYRLFDNSESLLNFYNSPSRVSIFEFLISRLPYVFVSATILFTCFAVCRFLISEIISINRRRQELYKVSIIASDVAYASQDALDLDETTRYELRTQTKMELLKEHLRANIGSDFVYAPGASYRRRLMMQRSQSNTNDPIDESPTQSNGNSES